MLVKDLDGHVYRWILKGNIAKGKMTNKSSLHLQARKLLVEAYPTLQILEEVTVQVRKNESLYLDFYLPLKKICFETHGEQHYKFVSFYHGNILNFIKSQKRDRDKEQWCLNNNISYIVLKYDENIEKWTEKIKNA